MSNRLRSWPVAPSSGLAVRWAGSPGLAPFAILSRPVKIHVEILKESSIAQQREDQRNGGKADDGRPFVGFDAVGEAQIDRRKPARDRTAASKVNPYCGGRRQVNTDFVGDHFWENRVVRCGIEQTVARVNPCWTHDANGRYWPRPISASAPRRQRLRRTADPIGNLHGACSRSMRTAPPMITSSGCGIYEKMT